MKPYYEHAGITIYHGDCREILPTLLPVDLVFTSPPYAEQREYTGACSDPWNAVVPTALSLVRVSGPGQILVNLGLIHKDGEVIEYWNTLIAAMRSAAFRLFGWYVWDQGSGLPGDWNGRLAPSHEFVFHLNMEATELSKSVKCVSFGRTITGTGLRRKDDSTAGKFSGQGAAWDVLWLVVGMTEKLVQARLAEMPALSRVVLGVTFGEELRVQFANMVMLEMERRTR